MRNYSREIKLESYLPAVTDASSDIRETMYAENPELQKLWDEMCVILANQFITYMDSYSTGQWESILDITTLDIPLNERKAEILKVLRGLRPYTIVSFKRILNSIYGNNILDVKCINDKYELWITIEPALSYRVNDLRELAERIVPLNLMIFIQELRQSSGQLFVSGYARMNSFFSAQGGTIGFEKVYGGRFQAGYARLVENLKAGEK